MPLKRKPLLALGALITLSTLLCGTWIGRQLLSGVPKRLWLGMTMQLAFIQAILGGLVAMFVLLVELKNLGRYERLLAICAVGATWLSSIMSFLLMTFSSLQLRWLSVAAINAQSELIHLDNGTISLAAGPASGPAIPSDETDIELWLSFIFTFMFVQFVLSSAQLVAYACYWNDSGEWASSWRPVKGRSRASVTLTDPPLEMASTASF